MPNLTILPNTQKTYEMTEVPTKFSEKVGHPHTRKETGKQIHQKTKYKKPSFRGGLGKRTSV